MSGQAGNSVLRTIRKDLKITQREVAEKSELTCGYICSIERGKRRIGPDAAVRIERAYRSAFVRLGFTLDDLLASGCTKLPHRAQDSGVGGTPDTRPAA